MYTGIKEAKILIPNVEDYSSWAVIACDQFTSEPEYWKQLEKEVANKPSALNVVYPEIYLKDRPEERIAKINKTMQEYLENGIFRPLDEGFVLTIRSTPFVEKRVGLIACIDLDEYDFAKGSKPLIRATESTIEERIPPRLKIRKDAPLEFPHVMVLIDDEKREIIEDLYARKEEFEKIYDFTLNMGGGHIEGYYIPKSENVIEKFSSLLDEERLIKKYGKNDKFAFAVGDGNHSLATAKAHYNNVKNSTQNADEISKYALVEIVNIYDEGIYFEPIYRWVKGVDKQKFLSLFASSINATCEVYNGKDFTSYNGGELPESIKNVDEFISDYINKFGGEVDYIHGKENLKNLVDGDSNSVGILFDKLDKKDLFRFVSNNGALPRKTFSMGEGVEKRYYLEGRKIK